MNEHVLPAIVTDDETEALLRIEEFDDALAFANDLRRHSSAAAAEAAATAAAIAAATAAAEAAAITEATTTTAAAEAATVAEAAATAKATALLVTSTEFLEIVFAETVALITTATAAVSFAPSIETHNRPNLICPLTPETNALGQKGATGQGA
jgi:hypothetical protein